MAPAADAATVSPRPDAPQIHPIHLSERVIMTMGRTALLDFISDNIEHRFPALWSLCCRAAYKLPRYKWHLRQWVRAIKACKADIDLFFYLTHEITQQGQRLDSRAALTIQRKAPLVFACQKKFSVEILEELRIAPDVNTARGLQLLIQAHRAVGGTGNFMRLLNAKRQRLPRGNIPLSVQGIEVIMDPRNADAQKSNSLQGHDEEKDDDDEEDEEQEEEDEGEQEEEEGDEDEE